MASRQLSHDRTTLHTASKELHHITLSVQLQGDTHHHVQSNPTSDPCRSSISHASCEAHTQCSIATCFLYNTHSTVINEKSELNNIRVHQVGTIEREVHRRPQPDFLPDEEPPVPGLGEAPDADASSDCAASSCAMSPSSSADTRAPSIFQ